MVANLFLNHVNVASKLFLQANAFFSHGDGIVKIRSSCFLEKGSPTSVPHGLVYLSSSEERHLTCTQIQRHWVDLDVSIDLDVSTIEDAIDVPTGVSASTSLLRGASIIISEDLEERASVASLVGVSGSLFFGGLPESLTTTSCVLVDEGNYILILRTT